MAKKKKDGEKKKGGFMSSPIGLAVLVMLVIGAFQPGAFLLSFFGMLPSLLMYALERSKGKQEKATMFFLNSAAVIPFMFDLLLTRGGSFTESLNFLIDINVWLVIYGICVLAYFLQWGAGLLTGTVIDVFAKSKVQSLREKQDKLMDEYGSVVSDEAQKVVMNAARAARNRS